MSHVFLFSYVLLRLLNSCPLGATSSVKGSSSASDCSNCPVNTYGSTQTGVSVCEPCRNSTSPANSASIDMCTCDVNHYGPGGHAAEGVGCQVCPVHSYSPRSSSTLEDCSCDVNHYGTGGHGDADDGCTACPLNSYSHTNGSTLAGCTCNVDTWSITGNAADEDSCIAQCSATESGNGCAKCTNHSSTAGSDGSVQTGCLCDAGYQGNAGLRGHRRSRRWSVPLPCLQLLRCPAPVLGTINIF